MDDGVTGESWLRHVIEYLYGSKGKRVQSGRCWNPTPCVLGSSQRVSKASSLWSARALGNGPFDVLGGHLDGARSDRSTAKTSRTRSASVEDQSRIQPFLLRSLITQLYLLAMDAVLRVDDKSLALRVCLPASIRHIDVFVHRSRARLVEQTSVLADVLARVARSIAILQN